MKIKPLGSRVLISVEEVKDKTTSGIYIPQSAQEKTQIGTVVAVGDGTKDVKIEVKPGQKVMYEKYSGMSFKDDGVDYLLIKYEDILSIIE